MKGTPKVPLNTKSDLNKPEAKPAFKSGGALPSVPDDKENKSKVKFAEPNLDDDDDEDDGLGSDFDANELLDFSDYQKKR